MLVDSHCHLDYPDFADELDAVIARAAEAGVGTMLTISTKLSQFEAVRAVAERYENVYCTVGIHPHEAASEPETDAETLLRLAEHPKVVGFGESGLDYFYEYSPREAQQRSFRAHIAAARRAQLPLVVHTRDADADTLAILREETAKGAFPGLIHCFGSDAAMARACVGLGFTISFSGIVTFKKAGNVREAVAEVPDAHLLVETDAPYLAPVPKRGKRNEPAYVAYTAAEVAKLRGAPVDAVARTTTDNFFRLFGKTARP